MKNSICDYYLNSARGWVELGNCSEASKELDRITPSQRTHPDILEVRWQIYAKGELWTAAFEMALAICEIAPNRLTGWVCLAESLYHRGQVPRAREILLGIASKFPDVSLIPYKLACYSSRLNLEGESKRWIDKAIACRDFREIASQALQEPALKKFREMMRERLDNGSNANASNGLSVDLTHPDRHRSNSVRDVRSRSYRRTD